MTAKPDARKHVKRAYKNIAYLLHEPNAQKAEPGPNEADFRSQTGRVRAVINKVGSRVAL